MKREVTLSLGIVMAVLGAFAFTSAVQGFFVTRNAWYDIPLLLGAALILFHPGALSAVFKMNGAVKYFFYVPGLVTLMFVYLMQKKRGQNI